MANWQTIPGNGFDRRERVPVRGGWLVKEWQGYEGRMVFVADEDHAWDGAALTPNA